MSQEHTRSMPKTMPRAGVALAAVLAAALVWLAFDPIGGMDLQQPAFDSGAAPTDLGLGQVLFASAMGAALAWITLAALERLTQRARRTWTIVAVIALLVSLGGPMGGEGITTGNRLVLALMHVVVAAVLIRGLPREAVAEEPAPAHRLGTLASARQG